MSWTDRSPAITATHGSYVAYLEYTSTGTLYDESLGVLRMFGVNGKGFQDAIVAVGGPDEAWSSSAPADPGEIEQDAGSDSGGNLCYIDSDGTGSFGLTNDLDARPVITTVIPTKKTGRLLSYVANTYSDSGIVSATLKWGYFDVLYGDPHPVKLGEGRGTLLVLT